MDLQVLTISRSSRTRNHRASPGSEGDEMERSQSTEKSFGVLDCPYTSAFKPGELPGHCKKVAEIPKTRGCMIFFQQERIVASLIRINGVFG